MAAPPPNAFAAPPPAVTLTLEETRAALDEVEVLLADPANQEKLNMAKNMAGDDPMKLMIMVMPISVQILAPVLAKYKFPVDQAGGMMFLAAAGAHKEDPAIVAKATEIKSKFIPPELAALAGMFMAPPGGGGGMPPMGMMPPMQPM